MHRWRAGTNRVWINDCVYAGDGMTDEEVEKLQNEVLKEVVTSLLKLTILGKPDRRWVYAKIVEILNRWSRDG
jgi:hypothetical protein